MNRQEFIEKFEVAQNFYKNSIELCEALHKSLLDGHSVVSFGSTLLNSYLSMLAESSGIDADTLGWLLFEGGGNCYKFNDRNTPYLVITPADLWDFYKND